MNKHSLLRVFSAVMATLMIVTVVPVFASASSPLVSFPSKYKSMRDMINEAVNQPVSEKEVYGEDDEVVFIVEMTQKPLLEVKTSSKVSMSDYIKSAAGAKVLRSIENEQAKALSVIEKKYSDTMDVLYRYDTVFNGFSVRARYGDKAKLEALDGVTRVTLSETHEYVEPINGYTEAETSSGKMLNSDEANKNGYTGKGTVTAIIDTGLDTDHEAFRNDPESPRFTLTDVENAVSAGLNAGSDAESCYKSEKIPFAYDYAGGDADVRGGESHGTHVAGTVGADNEKLSGVAPDTQLVIMKVFPDEGGGADDSYIMAALEDAVVLGVDTINMSLGSASGFTSITPGEDEEESATDRVYNNVKNAGICLMCAAGNDYSAPYSNAIGTDLALVENPDSGIVGSPSTYNAAVSVASVNEAASKMSYFMAGEKKVRYTDTAEDAAVQWTSLEGDFDFEVVGGYGSAADFAAVDVQNKVALVQRGELAFTDKEANAKSAGAVALIVYDNIPDEALINMQVNGLMPAIFVSYEDGQFMRGLQTKKISTSAEFVDEVVTETSGLMSDFSSLGVAPDLTLKPEITAPGGDVWSTLPGDAYGNMSGTSMASPHMAGAAAVVREYVNEKFSDYSPAQKREMINNLLLSTATQVTEPDGTAYTPRKQGAGLANVWNAIRGESYLTVKDSERPKAELGYNTEGTYSFEFTVHNFSEAAKEYDISVIPLTAKTETVEVQTETGETKEYNCISESSRVLTSDEFTVELSDSSVRVEPDGTATVTVKLTLTEAGKESLEEFVNGTFLDGFVVLTDKSEDGVNLSLPYLAFYGDWAKVPVFDSTIYDDKEAQEFETELDLLQLIGSDLYGFTLGSNLFLEEDDYEQEKNFFNPTYAAAGYSVVPVTGLLRAPKKLSYGVTEVDLEEGYDYIEAPEVMKSFYYASGGYITYDILHPSLGFSTTYLSAFGWDPAVNHNFTFDLTATVDGTDGETQPLKIPFGYDVTAPQIVSTEFFTKEAYSEVSETVEDVDFVRVTVQDENFIMGVQLYTSQEFFDGETYSAIPLSDVYTDESIKEKGNQYVFEIPLDFAEYASLITGDTRYVIEVIDYAFNGYDSEPISLVGGNEVTKVTINTKPLSATAGGEDMILQAYVEPDNLKDVDITWSTEDTDIISVESNGYNEASGFYEATLSFIPGSEGGEAHVTASAPNGVSDTVEFPVSKAMYAPTIDEWDGVVRYNGPVKIPENFNKPIIVRLDGILPDAEPNVTLIGSNSADNPYTNTITVEKEGTTLAIRNLNMTTTGANSAITFAGRGNTLAIEGENLINVTGDGAGVYVPYGAELTVTGGMYDKLTLNLNSNNAYKPVGGAGIGGIKPSGYGLAETAYIAGDIILKGGNIDIKAYYSDGAGIGGGVNGIVDSVTVDGANITMDIKKAAGSMGNMQGGAGIGSGANVGSGRSYFPNYEMDIVIGGGSTITGTSDGQGALIGSGYVGFLSTSSLYKTNITVNAGVLNLTGNNTAVRYGGALIGAGSGMNVGDIVINGGNITAVQNSPSASAIGTGSNTNAGGTVTINGGTISATVPSNSTASAIGMGGVNSGSPTNTVVKINGGSVKAKKAAAEGAEPTVSVTGDVTNTDGAAVHEVKLTAGSEPFEGSKYWPTTLTVDGKSFDISGYHFDDEFNLYPWLTVGTHTVTAALTGGKSASFNVEVEEDGTYTVTNMYELGAFLTHVTPDEASTLTEVEGTRDEETGEVQYAGNLVAEGSTVEVTLTPEDGYLLPTAELVSVVVDGFNNYDYSYDPETGKVTVPSVSGNTYIKAVATVDKSELLALIQEAGKINSADYDTESEEGSTAWTYFLFAASYASGIYTDPTVTSGMVEGAITALQNAIDALEPFKLHDTDALEAALAKAEEAQSNSESYMDESIEGLDKLIEEANNVLQNPDSTQTEINTATEQLELALAKLVKVTRGDVNLDGRVNIVDLIMLKANLAGVIGADAINAYAADVDGENGVGTSDILALAKLLAR